MMMISSCVLLPTQVRAVNVGFPVPDAVWAVSVAVGITVTSILFCSHFHQIDGDRAAGKMSPLVRLGAPRALQVFWQPFCSHSGAA